MNAILALLVPWLVGAGAAAGAVTPPPTPSDLQAVRLDGAAIRLDGVPDEPTWRRGSTITGLTSWDPVEGGPPAGQMTAWVFYDTDALYVAARIDLPRGALRGRPAARERWNNDDLFEITLDPFLDRRTGYDFAVTPFGVQIDYTVVDDAFSSAWDGVWDSAVARDADGFSAEVRIPFRTLRLSSAPVQDWGFGLGFFSGMKKEYDKWPAVSNDRGTLFQQLGVLRGLSGIRTSHNLDLIPTLLAGYGGADDHGRFAWDRPVLLRARDPGLLDLGLDVRYAVSSTTNLNLTLNPDFSQVEADTDQLVYNLRYPIILDEKRPFFLEGVSIFTTPVPLLYTRSIVDPIGGLKLSGRTGPWSFGLLSAYDELPLASRLTGATRVSGFEEVGDDDAVDTVGRATYDLGAAGHVGVFAADKQLVDRRTGGRAAGNAVVAADTQLSFAEVYTLIAQVAASTVDHAGERFDGLSSSLTARRHDQHLSAELRSDYDSSGFRAETSPITRVGVLSTTASASYRFTPHAGALSFIEPGVDAATIHDADTTQLLDASIKPHLAARLGANTDVSVSYQRGQETFVERFRGIDRVEATVSTYPRNSLSVSLDLVAGDQIDYDPADPFLGRLAQATLGVSVLPFRITQLDLRYTKSRLWRPDGAVETDADLYYGKLSATFSPRLALRVISQVDTYLHQLSDSALFTYEVHPGTEGYLGYQELDQVGAGARPLDRRIFFKLSYRWQL